MFFNQFDVTVQFDVTADGGQSSVKMRLPSAKAEDLSLIQNFNDLWKRGTKEKGAGDVVVAEADTEEQAAEKPQVSDAESARPDFAPELLEKWAELKQTDCSKEDVWNFARKTIPSAGDEAIVKGERILFSAVSSLVLLDPRIKNDSELTLTRVRDAVKHDLDTLGSFFAPNQISDLQHAALDAFELFKTLPDELQFASHAALVKWLGA